MEFACLSRLSLRPSKQSEGKQKRKSSMNLSPQSLVIFQRMRSILVAALTSDADDVAVLLLVAGEVPVDGAAGGVGAVVVCGGSESQRGQRHERRRRLVLLDEEAAVARGQHAPAHRELEARRGLGS